MTMAGAALFESASEVVVVGRILSLFGVRGWVKVASFTEPTGNLLTYRPWLLCRQEGWRELEVAEVSQRTGKRGGFIVRINGCENREAAADYVGLDIGVVRSVLPPPGNQEYYWRDLTGCRVQTVEGIELGVIDHLFATGANDVMVVRGATRERLIPFIAQVVSAVESEAGLVVVDWNPDF